MAFCLPQEQVDKFKNALRTGEVSLDDLQDLAVATTAERREFMTKYFGADNAKEVNALFESKLLLKNQKRGLISWARKVSGGTKRVKKETIDKINSLKSAIDEDFVLEDIVGKRLGIEVTEKEAKEITRITSQMNELYENAAAKLPEGTPPTKENVEAILRDDTDLKYFRLKNELNNYIGDQTPWQVGESAPRRFINNIAEVAGLARSIKTGLDLSAPLRQGMAYFGRREWNQALRRMFGYARSADNLEDLKVQMLANKYSKEALDVKRDLGLTLLGEKFTQREEAFASKLSEKIPVLRGSERAYEGFLNDLRFNRFVNMVDDLEKSGVKITEDKKAMKDLAQVIAAATGRGTLGSAEGAAKSLATVLFSPRWIASRLQVIFNPLAKTGVSRKEAIKSFATLAGVATSVLGLMKMAGADVEEDPRSSDFGKFKIGDTRFDVTGGVGPYIKLVSQILTGSTKSSTTGKINELNSSDWGARTKLDVMTDFITNKASPVFGFLRDWAKGQTFEGEPLELALDEWDEMGREKKKKFAEHMFKSLMVPLIAETTIETYQNASDESKFWLTAGTVGAELFGIGSSTYGYVPGGKKADDYKKKYGENEFDKAVGEINDIMEEELKKLEKTQKFKDVDDDERNAMINKVIDRAKKKGLRPPR